MADDQAYGWCIVVVRLLSNIWVIISIWATSFKVVDNISLSINDEVGRNPIDLLEA